MMSERNRRSDMNAKEELKTLSFALSELGDVMRDISLCIMR